jgi:hypothetical protein
MKKTSNIKNITNKISNAVLVVDAILGLACFAVAFIVHPSVIETGLLGGLGWVFAVGLSVYVRIKER